MIGKNWRISSLKQPACSIALALVLVVGCSPAAAWASLQSSPSAKGDALQARASKVTVYVLSKEVRKGASVSYSYGKNGFLSKSSEKAGSSSFDTVWKHTSKGALKSVTEKWSDRRSEFKTNGSGVLTKETCVKKNGTDKDVIAYKVSSGKVASFTHTYYSSRSGKWAKAGQYTMKLAYKKGNLSKLSESSGSGTTTRMTYAYDAKGNLK